MTYIKTTLAIMVAVLATGCFDVELEIPVATQVATIKGNLALHNAKARLYGEILEPARIDKFDAFKSQQMDSIRLETFAVRVTADALLDAEDVDDLAFVESMVIYVRSVNPDTTLPDVAVAWYYADETEHIDLEFLEFEVDSQLGLDEYFTEGFELFSKSVGMVPADDVSVQALASFVATPAN